MAVIANHLNPSNPTVGIVAQEYVQTRKGFLNLVIRPGIQAINWMQYFKPTISPFFLGLRKVLKYTKHCTLWIGYPDDLRLLHRSVVKLKKSFFKGSIQKITNQSLWTFFYAGEVIGLLGNSLEILHKESFIVLSPSQLKILGGIETMGSIGLLIAGILGIKKQLKILSKPQISSEEFNHGLLRLMSRVALVALGIFGIVGYEHFAKLLVLIVSSTFLFFTVCSYFYRKLYIEKNEKSVAL